MEAISELALVDFRRLGEKLVLFTLITKFLRLGPQSKPSVLHTTLPQPAPHPQILQIKGCTFILGGLSSMPSPLV